MATAQLVHGCSRVTARKPPERWTRSVIPTASRLQSGVVLILPVHVPAVVLPCLLRGCRGLSSRQRGCDMRAATALDVAGQLPSLSGGQRWMPYLRS
jgi:hypothetical protein